MRRTSLIAAVLAAAACGGSDGPTGNNGSPSGDVIVGNNFFNPATLGVTVGDEVVWAWVEGAVVHNIVFVDGAPGSGERSSGTFARTFTADGAYSYFCSIHTAAVMSGVINVAAAGTGGGGGDGGDGGGDGGDGGGGGGGGGGGYY